MNFKTLKLIIRLARLHFLVLGFLLYVLGYLLALVFNSQVDLPRFMGGYMIFALAHLSLHFSNDYFDRFSDRCSDKTFFSGGSKVLVEHPELERLALRMAALLLIASAASMFVFTLFFRYSYWFFIFGILGGLTGWFYTAPPLKLAYRGLGEPATMLGVGLIMPGMGYVAASGMISLQFMVFVLPLSLYALFFIITVELPDLESDSIAKKRNLVVKWGRKTGKGISTVATAVGACLLAAIGFSGIVACIDLKPIFFLSIVPLTAAIASFAANSEEREKLVRQVMINMASMVLFVFGFDLFLISQL